MMEIPVEQISEFEPIYEGCRHSMAAGLLHAIQLTGPEPIVILNTYDLAEAGSPKAEGFIKAINRSFDHSPMSLGLTLAQTIESLEKIGAYTVDYEKKRGQLSKTTLAPVMR